MNDEFLLHMCKVHDFCIKRQINIYVLGRAIIPFEIFTWKFEYEIRLICLTKNKLMVQTRSISNPNKFFSEKVGDFFFTIISNFLK